MTCSVCDNGYYEKNMAFNFTATDNANNAYNTSLTIKICRKCSLDIVSDNNQNQLVRRCKVVNNNLQITQCGSSLIPNYPVCYDCSLNSSADESVYRGPNVNIKEHLETNTELFGQYLLNPNDF